MEDKKYQIFVSSTYTDLIEERDIIIKAILDIYHIPIGMEMFSADDEEQWETIQKTIDKSDYYILILGLKYGSTDDGISFTEKEYDYALSQNKPILSFILKDDTPLSKDKRDNDLTLVEAFRNKVLTNNKMADFWSNGNELGQKVTTSLFKQINRNPQIGWLRADSLGFSQNVSEEIAILSTENRQLREENESLKSKFSNRKVNLELKINGNSNLTIQYPKTIDSTFFMEIPKKMTLNNCAEILKSYIKEDCYKLNNAIGQLVRSMQSINGEKNLCIDSKDVKYITQSMIDEYNQQLPSTNLIDEYNIYIGYYERVRLGSDISFDIENSGTLTATSLIINIVLPNEVLVMDKLLKEEKYPSFDSKPKMPNTDEFIEKIIQKRKLNNSSPTVNNFSHTPMDFNHLIHNNPNDYLMKNLSPLLNKSSEKVELIDSHNLVISIDKLLHTQKISFNDYIFIPKNVGDFEIKVTIISEEMEQSKEFFIPIKVE